jgi:hypothetical protein
MRGSIAALAGLRLSQLQNARVLGLWLGATHGEETLAAQLLHGDAARLQVSTEVRGEGAAARG